MGIHIANPKTVLYLSILPTIFSIPTYLLLTFKLSNMKAIVLLILIPAITYSQASKEPKESQEKSKIETFSLKTGSLIKKDFATLGYVKKVEVQTLKLSDVLMGTAIS